ncbi:MAG: hypothetical protein A3D96_05725 [Chlamydiae bacterium RIFCSPHIGHO2_12_FULL_44_59]|nr:MAG: hypothetical protein A2796_03555 [Chlamydiae bacterium RIFCSPHIGHO2_01_FULL_44_39]OGN59119.1 MAG: hypothetical protein A3C42_02570 [Chlamydiae bacterium RIFCSPHIGHO2_02_FULL_45_9]OGN61130.1 MAG: hypothetical protein A3D96_05725 [Chlamydiae bacterium RIFCSPHIGHO2_12_FULL_44_59]OGN65600.1 MAG: hypothetical protein A2978_06530 [Chlamydiae bacterium RIFCSPLOWO2_01_FULL_44_52]OGN68077.1 MAG: hypothetical protein A3I67_05200 [Chlamydiae bacterium RIFCSPLOWO2_02_FULL_45_22]OGN68966.1 MAG: hyp
MLDTHWAECFDLKDPLIHTRKKAWDRFEQIGLPRSKQEAFQYVRKEFCYPKPASQKRVSQKSEEGLVFVDGFFDEASSTIPGPLIVLPIEKAMKSYGLFLQSRMQKVIQEEMDPFAALNGAFQGSGAFLYVPPKCKAALQIVHVLTQDGMASPRLHIYLGRGARLELEQISQGKSEFSNAFLDCVLDQDATMKWVDRSEGDFVAVRALLKKSSKLTTVSLGKLFRTSLKVELAEEEAEAELYGLAEVGGNTQTHFHALVEHIAPRTKSRQHFKSVLKESSRFSFEGKIYVHSEAQKTEAYQLNNNMVLSDDAAAHAKPNLEIFADDVKASHGATVGGLNEEQLFYLRTRGLSQAMATDWLIRGFCQEILDHA